MITYFDFTVRLILFRLIAWAGKRLFLNAYYYMGLAMGVENALDILDPARVIEFVETFSDAIEFTLRKDYAWDYYEWSVRKFTKYYVHDTFVTFIMFLDDEFDNRMIDHMWDLSVPLRNWATK